MEQQLISTLSGVRRLKGIGQKELAEKMGITTITLSKWEKGRTSPTLSQFTKWCEMLGYKLKLENA